MAGYEVLAYLVAWGGLGAFLAYVSKARGRRWRQRDPFPIVVVGATGSRE